MAELLKGWGYVALVVDSFSARGLKDVCGRNWPNQAAAEARAHDIDAALAWLGKQSFVDARRWPSWAIPTAAASPCCARCHRFRHGSSDTGARGDPGLSRLRAGRCAGRQTRGPPADAAGDGRPRRLDAGVAMQGGAGSRRAGPRPDRDAHLRGRVSQLRRARPAGALSRRRRQPQQAGRLLRRALRRQRGGLEGVRRRR